MADAPEKQTPDNSALSRRLLTAWVALQLKRKSVDHLLDDLLGAIEEARLGGAHMKEIDDLKALASDVVMAAVQHRLNHHKPHKGGGSAGDVLLEMLRAAVNDRSGGPPIRRG